MFKLHGMKILDGKRKLEVTIKPSDVSKAGVQNPSKCAAAQALCRDPNIAEARVHISRTYVREKGAKHWLRFGTPGNLRTEIVAFDKGAKRAFDVEQTFALTPTKQKATGKRQGSAKNANIPKAQRGPKEKRTYILTHIRPNANSEWDGVGTSKAKR